MTFVFQLLPFGLTPNAATSKSFSVYAVNYKAITLFICILQSCRQALKDELKQAFLKGRRGLRRLHHAAEKSSSIVESIQTLCRAATLKLVSHHASSHLPCQMTTCDGAQEGLRRIIRGLLTVTKCNTTGEDGP